MIIGILPLLEKAALTDINRALGVTIHHRIMRVAK